MPQPVYHIINILMLLSHCLQSYDDIQTSKHLHLGGKDEN